MMRSPRVPCHSPVHTAGSSAVQFVGPPTSDSVSGGGPSSEENERARAVAPTAARSLRAAVSMTLFFASARRLLALARRVRRQRAKAPEPAGDQGTLGVTRFLVLFDRLAPVEADPTVDV